MPLSPYPPLATPASSPPTPAAGTPQNYEEALRIAEAREREVRGYFDKYDLDGSGTAARSKCSLGSDRARVQRLLRTPGRSSHPRGWAFGRPAFGARAGRRRSRRLCRFSPAGTIDMEEILAIMEEMGLLKNLKTDRIIFCSEMFVKYDANNDGVLRYIALPHFSSVFFGWPAQRAPC